MNIQQFTQDLQLFYGEMSSAFSEFQKTSGLQCPSGCAKCCDNPDISATTLEMLPMAWDFYQKGIAEEWLEKLSTQDYPVCAVLKMTAPGSMNGQCTAYEFRSTMCRQFGLGKVNTKDGSQRLAVCKYLREKYGEEHLNQTNAQIENAPSVSEWTRRLSTLHPDLISHYQPVSKALREALEKVLLYTQYSQ